MADALADAVGDRPGAVPRPEDRLDRTAELLHRLLWERLARVRLDDLLVELAQLLQFGGSQLGIGLDLGASLGLLERMVEQLAFDIEHDAAVHRDEAAVAVVREPLVVGDLGEPFDALVVEAEVQHGVHHPGHRELGA